MSNPYLFYSKVCKMGWKNKINLSVVPNWYGLLHKTGFSKNTYYFLKNGLNKGHSISVI